jgi:hypothetical protein
LRATGWEVIDDHFAPGEEVYKPEGGEQVHATVATRQLGQELESLSRIDVLGENSNSFWDLYAVGYQSRQIGAQEPNTVFQVTHCFESRANGHGYDTISVPLTGDRVTDDAKWVREAELGQKPRNREAGEDHPVSGESSI